MPGDVILYKKRISLQLLLVFCGFILGISRGYVAVWQDEDPLPLYLTDTPAEILPPEDEAMLRRGLRLPDQAALTAALEDFCS